VFFLNKKILCISDHSNMLGGGEYSFLDLLHYLPAPLKTIAVVPSNGELSLLLREVGVETHIIQLSTIRLWTLHKMLKTMKQIVNLCRKIQPALIYSNGSRAAFYAGASKPFHKLPVIWHCRIADRDPYLDLLLVYLTNLIVTNSLATAKRFKSNFQQKIKVIHNGVDIKWMTDMAVEKPKLIQDDWKVILKVARVSRRKKHNVILDAFEQVAGLIPDAHLFCIGAKDVAESEWWDFLQKRTQQSVYSERIHWVGQVEDVRPWYRAADILVLGSLGEAFGRVLVEAMACGVTVIATRSGGVPEIVRHGQDGLLVPPGNIDEMAEAMTKMLQDESLRKRASHSAQERAGLFSLDNHVDRMVQIFEETISLH